MFPRQYTEFFIDGEWRASDSEKQFVVTSPSTGEEIGSVPSASTADIDAAVEAARRAFYETDWAHRPVEERARLCEALGAKLLERKSDMVDLIVDELGCTTMLAEVYQAAAPTLHWNYTAQLGRSYPFSEVRRAQLGPLVDLGQLADGEAPALETTSLVLKEPVGVVATMVAYNFALPGTAQKVAPALVAGCTVVIKVPEPNPLATFAMAQLVAEVGFPPGVINVVAAGPEASAHLVSHPDVDMVSFTGSTEVGTKIAEACAQRVRPAVLELGGKSAAIVLEDADLDTVVPTLLGTSVIANSGQSCVCQSRFLLPSSKYDEIVERLVAAVAHVKVGDPRDPATAMGPLITEAHRTRVLGMIERAKADGATVAFGGGVPEGLEDGWYVEPTLLTDVTPDMEIAQEEVFGPVVAIIRYEDEDEAVAIANNSKYGLAGSVFTGDVSHGFEIARRIRTGTFAVNTFTVDVNAPFGGFKKSGIGRENGVEGLEHYLVPKTIAVLPNQSIPEDILAAADKVTEGVGKGSSALV